MAIRNFSAEAFGAGGGGLLVPRQKFNFTLVLIMADQAMQFARVSNVTAAGYSFDTLIANQYNKKRVIQTKLNYDPITVSFYDTFDNQFHNIMRRYIQHYYNGGMGIEGRVSLEGNETINASFNTDQGFTPNSDRYFFPSISIVQNGFANQHRETVLINSMITEVRGDTLDSSDSQPVQYSVTFQPESVQTLQVGTQFISDTSVEPTDFNVLVGGFGDDVTAGTDTRGADLTSPQPSTSPVSLRTFDTLVDALLNSNGLVAGQAVIINGESATADFTTDGQVFFINPSTGSSLG